MKKVSAGILLYRFKNDELQVFLVHPGGPFWYHKDRHTWSIPKGEVEDGEDLLATAKREFEEETGQKLNTNKLIQLNPVKQKGGKIVYAWATEGDLNPADLKSNTFELEWPPKSGNLQSFPEIDKGAWFSIGEAMEKINEAQKSFLTQLVELINKS